MAMTDTPPCDLPPQSWFTEIAHVASAYYGSRHQREMSDTERRYALDLALRLVSVRQRLVGCRNILTPWDRLAVIYGELLKAQYQEWRWEIAEAWILRGNWQYVTPKVLTADMFFPAPECVKTLTGEKMITLTAHKAELKTACVASYQQGKSDEHQRVSQQSAGQSPSDEAKASLRQYTAMALELMEAKSANEELREQITLLQHQSPQEDKEDYFTVDSEGKRTVTTDTVGIDRFETKWISGEQFQQLVFKD